MGNFTKKLWIGLCFLALLSPAGILLPRLLHSGKPWGEWTTEEIAKDRGSVPKGMQKDAALYSAPVPDYNFGKKEDPIWKLSGSYVISGMVGLGSYCSNNLCCGKKYTRRNERPDSVFLTFA